MSRSVDVYEDPDWVREHYEGTNRHHVPPQHPDPEPQYKLVKDKLDHFCYHRLFGNAKSFQDAVKILKRDWWPQTPN